MSNTMKLFLGLSFVLVLLSGAVLGSMLLPEAEALIPEIKSESPEAVEPAVIDDTHESAASSSEEGIDSLFVRELDVMVEALAGNSLKENCTTVSSEAVDEDGYKIPALPGSGFEHTNYEICTSFQELELEATEDPNNRMYRITVPLVSGGERLQPGFEHDFVDLVSACDALNSLTLARTSQWINFLAEHEPDADLVVELGIVCGQTFEQPRAQVKVGAK